MMGLISFLLTENPSRIYIAIARIHWYNVREKSLKEHGHAI